MAAIFASGLSGCATIDTERSYAFQPTSVPASEVSFLRASSSLSVGSGAVVIRSIDGVDTRHHPLLQSTLKDGRYIPLAPRSISVAAGEHSLGLLYILSDALFDGSHSSLWWGKYMTKQLSVNIKEKYAPNLTYASDNHDHIVTLKHYEVARINMRPGFTYKIDVVSNKTEDNLQFILKECASGATSSACEPLDVQVSQSRTGVASGYSYTDLLR
jgi:hypothetical protein